MSTATLRSEAPARGDVRPQPRVLVVDNESSIRFVLRELMEREGYAVEEAADGDIAVDLVRQSEFDVAVMDIRMPRLDGIEALRQMKQLRPQIVVVMITAFGSEQLALEATRAGAYDYFRKPFEVEELRTQRMSYRRTTNAWWEGLKRNEAHIRATWGDVVYEDYDRYLRTCVKAFDNYWSSDVQMKLRWCPA